MKYPMWLSAAGAALLSGCTTMAEAPMDIATDGTVPTAAMPRMTGVFAQPSSLPFGAPDFSKISDADFKPALEAAIAIKRAEIAAIAGDPAAPTFENTIVAMERAGQDLDRVDAVFSVMTGANTNPTLDEVDSAVSPQQAALRDFIYLNEKLFARVKALQKQADTLNLDPDQARLLDITYRDFVGNGALLNAAQKAQVTTINARLATLSTDFSQKLTAGTKDGALVIGDKAALAGMSAAGLAAAATDAAGRGIEGKYLIPLQNTTQQPALAALSNRATRQALFEKSWNRSERGDGNDTRAIIVETAQLRAQKAQLLGYPDYASYVMRDNMARNPATALKFMNQMVPALAATQTREAGDLNAMIKADGGKFTVTPADWDYYAEKLRKQKYAIDDRETKPYFEITRVLEDGVFLAANKLYGLSFKKRSDLPVYHPDVTVYTVIDDDGSELGLFYFDPWKRDNKRGGAWMSSFVSQSTLLGGKPVVYNVENFTKPAAGQPALVSFDDVTTMFHEFGHALHGLLSNQRYPSIAGTSTARDFVEFPSQFNENWATEPTIFASYARHYQTGAAMPQPLVDKMRKAAKFNQGYALGEVVTAALLDMKWHSLSAEAGPQDVDAFESAALASLGLQTDLVPPRYRTSYFRHIWSNGYAAAYYAYLWTEMLDHDAFDWFESNGGMTRANGDRFRQMVLSRGKSENYATMYRAFTGGDPRVEPMLKARGLVPE